jgi:hypothetical protein
VNTEIQWEGWKWGSNNTDTLWLSGFTMIDGVKVDLTRFNRDHFHLEVERGSMLIRHSLGHISFEEAVKTVPVFAHMVNAALGIYDAALSVREAA